MHLVSVHLAYREEPRRCPLSFRKIKFSDQIPKNVTDRHPADRNGKKIFIPNSQAQTFALSLADVDPSPMRKPINSRFECTKQWRSRGKKSSIRGPILNRLFESRSPRQVEPASAPRALASSVSRVPYATNLLRLRLGPRAGLRGDGFPNAILQEVEILGVRATAPLRLNFFGAVGRMICGRNRRRSSSGMENLGEKCFQFACKNSTERSYSGAWGSVNPLIWLLRQSCGQGWRPRSCQQ